MDMADLGTGDAGRAFAARRLARRPLCAFACGVRPMVCALLMLVMHGCADVEVRKYEPLTKALDGRNELHVSTYPAGFPSLTARIPYLYKQLRTPDALYFQFFVRNAEQGAGPNPHVESIHIRSFSYQFPDQAPVLLISGHDDYFWMQDDPDDDRLHAPPVPWSEGWYVRLQADLELNGQDYRIDETVHATSSRQWMPLLVHAMGV
jgi:hypothetical protein